MLMHKYFSLLLTLIFLVTPAMAEPDRYTSVELIPQHTHNIKAGSKILIATEITLAPDWHVYWVNPGDSGLPVQIKWTVPEGVTVEPIQWPTPDKISYNILANYGYYNSVKLLQNITIPHDYATQTITLSADIEMLVCNEICIPESETVTIILNDPNEPSQNNDQYIQKAKIKLPAQFQGAVNYAEENNKLVLTFEENENFAKKESLEFFPYEWGILKYVSEPSIETIDSKIVITHERDERSLDEIENLSGLIVLKGPKGQNKGFEITATYKDIETSATSMTTADKNKPQSQAPESGNQTNLTWLTAIGLALIGGLILNLMPCVFPVLSMKALSLVKLGEKENKHARQYGIAYTLGVVLSFVAMGVLLVALQQAGSAIGWGFQLQNPVVIALLIYLLFLIGLNLMGFFEFGNNLSNVGSKLTQGSSLSSSFFTGALVTFVAAPCIGPFLGAAMGYAITQPALFNILFFAALGLGLASPYLILSFVPASRTLLPKPGPWMKTFKELLAFPMFASSIVFIWVLSQQSGASAALVIMTGLLVICFAVWLMKFKKSAFVKLLLVLSIITTISTLFFVQNMTQVSSSQPVSFGKTFSEKALEEALNTKNPVFVEMTAAWCFTCKINHAVAININSTKKLFADKDVHYLIGDWTNHDETITKYLEKFGRNGVPLYVYYAPPDQTSGLRPEPKLLPQVLTPGIVQEIIGQD